MIRMNPRRPSHYDTLVEAAQTLNKELGFFTDESVEDEEEYTVRDIEHEIWLLNTSLDYYYTKGIYPFGTTRDAEEFSKNWVNMSFGEYVEENKKMRNKYKARVRKVCKMGQLLDPHEQEAFDSGNKIWGSRSGKKIEDLMVLAEDNSSNREEEEEQIKDPFEKFSLLKKSFKFGMNNVSEDLRIPVSSENVVKRGLSGLGNAKLKEWNEKWKKIEVDELKIFLEKVNLIRQQTMFLLAEIEY